MLGIKKARSYPDFVRFLTLHNTQKILSPLNSLTVKQHFNVKVMAS